MTDAPVFHGGDLSWAEARFGRPDQPWIDLSTGMNPWPYPIGAIGDEAWSRLPQARVDTDLREAAARYYGAPGVDYDGDGVNDTTWDDLAGNRVDCSNIDNPIHIGAIQSHSAPSNNPGPPGGLNVY